MFRTIGDRPSEWELRLPAEVLRLPEDLARVDALLDDPAFFAPFAAYFHPSLARPSTPAECYLRLMFEQFLRPVDLPGRAKERGVLSR
jgi:IS5 family transposase